MVRPANFQDIFGPGLARGSIAWHIASQEAQDIWNPNGRGWCINLMRRGAAVTLGPVSEPYVGAFPHGDIFVESLLSGVTVAESYWLALPHVSWAMVILGDPLYRPFASKPRPSLVARAYIADNPSRVLQPGEPTPLLVQVECVGIAGSGTPALSAVAAPEMGLAAASGSVAIPALKAGESAIVRVASVTSGDNPTGMFRLRLKVQTEGERSRQIVLEGRTGFSRLTGGLLPKSQMFVAPSGDFVISGQPGRSALIETATLRLHSISPSAGFGLVGADFAPDGAHIAMAVLDPQQQKGEVRIIDFRSGSSQPLPAGTKFLRWLDSNEILLLAPNRLIGHRIAGGEDRTFEYPTAWSGEIASGSVIPGTDIQTWGTKDGRLAVRRGSEPIREILAGTKATGFSAVSNDLTLAGGLDEKKQMWVQHGLDGTPEVVARGVERIIWGPISHRAVVLEAGNKGRVYDGRDGSWIDLGVISGAEWSPDEERLLFITAGGGGEEGYLSLLIDRRTERICTLSKLGPVAKITLSTDGERAFLLAGVAGGLDVWMMALPRRAPSRRMSLDEVQRGLIAASERSPPWITCAPAVLSEFSGEHALHRRHPFQLGCFVDALGLGARRVHLKPGLQCLSPLGDCDDLEMFLAASEACDEVGGARQAEIQNQDVHCERELHQHYSGVGNASGRESGESCRLQKLPEPEYEAQVLVNDEDGFHVGNGADSRRRQATCNWPSKTEALVLKALGPRTDSGGFRKPQLVKQSKTSAEPDGRS